MKKIFFVLILFLSSVLTVKAQAELGITPLGIFISNGSVYFGDSINFYFRIQNTGSEPYSGNIVIYYSVNDSLQGELDSLTTNYFIAPGDSVSVYVENWVVTTSICSVGDNIVVIWPVALEPNVPTSDSASIHFNVINNVGIEDNSFEKIIKIKYASDLETIYLDYGGLEDEIVCLELFSMNGIELLNYIKPPDQISLKTFSPQLFVLKIVLKDGRSASFKVIRPR
ncbi:MAG: hypothetical protein LH473_00275 [Chitinophagales bacterium]|nr:hypothetical protein [Chitinophagales bacterium]